MVAVASAGDMIPMTTGLRGCDICVCKRRRGADTPVGSGKVRLVMSPYSHANITMPTGLLFFIQPLPLLLWICAAGRM